MLILLLLLYFSRWLVRTAYGIEGGACEDCLAATFCPCCSANQILQTTREKGRPNSTGGKEFNLRPFEGNLSGRRADDFIVKFCYGCCCMPCATGSILEKGIGMPFFMGCCCVNICAARNFVRYQNRVKGEDLLEECFIPWATYCCGSVLAEFIPCFWCIVCPAFVLFIVQLLNEVEQRPTTQPRYLVGADENVVAAAITLQPNAPEGKVITGNHPPYNQVPSRNPNNFYSVHPTNPNYISQPVQGQAQNHTDIPIVYAEVVSSGNEPVQYNKGK